MGKLDLGVGFGGEEEGFRRTGSIFSSAYLNELLDIRHFFRHDGRVRVVGGQGGGKTSRLLFFLENSREFSITI